MTKKKVSAVKSSKVKAREAPKVQPDRLKLGKRLQHIRVDLYKETQKEFAARIGVGLSSLKMIESGSNFPTIPMLIRITRRCKISYQYLLEGK